MEEAVYRIALAGLLHDIGRFAQWIGWRKGRPAEVGRAFVQQFVPPAWQEPLYPVMGHRHRPLPDHATKVVALADRLAAGARISNEEEGEQPRPLRSIFCALTADGQKASSVRYWPLHPLRIDREALFPREEADPAEVERAYHRLRDGFQKEVQALFNAHRQGGQLPVYLESMLLLLQRYAWCVPSAYHRVLPDVSFYDHSRVTAALAVCLLGWEEAALDRALEAPEDKPDEVALLVGGDISGVQDFIYTITARGATSALRGRSFYLQLLTEAVARYVLRRLELPITNLIYQGGGGFYLLARPADRARLEEVRREVSRILLTHHQGDLYLALEAIPLAAADFYDGRISGKWRELGERLQKAKQRRFTELGEELRKRLFEPQGHGGNKEQECQVCGREHPHTKEEKEEGEEEGVRKCPPCLSYEGLGEDLRRARYLWWMEVEPAGGEGVEPGGWKEVLRAFGLQAGAVEVLAGVPNTGCPRWILALTDEAMSDLRPDAHTVIGRRFLVNVTPVWNERDDEWLQGLPRDRQRAVRRELPQPPHGKIKPFTVLAAQSTGIPRLGVLRMDVDNLGKLFSDGLGEAANLSRVAALSFAISLFFEGWVEMLAARIGRTEDGRDRLYSIYSGGDDLFFVGSWDAVVELARAIRVDFSHFVAGHPGLHTSAGIVLIPAKYPLYQAAREAGEAESQAKGLRWRDERGPTVGGKPIWRQKDALCFLGQALPWHRFGLEAACVEGTQSVHALAHRLERLTRPKEKGGADAPKALLQILIRLQEQYWEEAERRSLSGEDRNKAGEEVVYYGPWMWRGYYFLKRMAGRERKRNPEVAQAVDELAERLHGEDFRAIEWIGLAARWAELLGRS